MRRSVAVLAAMTLPIGAVADAPQGRQAVPVFGTGVQVVAVPAFVTDKDGRAVPGLTQDDFEVLDQGRRVPIVAFEAVDAGSAALLEPGTAPPPVQAAALVGLTTDRAQLAQAIQNLGLVEMDRLQDPLNLAWDLGAIDAVRPGRPPRGR